LHISLAALKPHFATLCLQITRTITHDNKHSQAASFTKARTHACVLARQLQDSQSDIKELLTEVADWQKVASETTAQLQQRDLQVSVEQLLLQPSGTDNNHE